MLGAVGGPKMLLIALAAAEELADRVALLDGAAAQRVDILIKDRVAAFFLLVGQLILRLELLVEAVPLRLEDGEGPAERLAFDELAVFHLAADHLGHLKTLRTVEVGKEHVVEPLGRPLRHPEEPLGAEAVFRLHLPDSLKQKMPADRHARQYQQYDDH